MAESDGYSPEFVEALNAWEQGPPLSAEFVFDLPPADPRKADKVGVLMYQAVLMKQDHPALDFARIRAVTFTMDVHRTGAELENIVGHNLPQFRNAAARLDAFHVNVAGGQVLIITDELAQASLSPQLATRLAAWELLRTELARSVAVVLLSHVPDAYWLGGDTAGQDRRNDTAEVRWRRFARYVWSEYFCGYHASVQAMGTPMARNRLRTALEEDPVALASAAAQFRADGDAQEWVARAEGCARGLCEAMAEVIGQTHATQSRLADVDPHLDTLIHTHALGGLWDALAQALQAPDRHPAEWASTLRLDAVAQAGQSLLLAYGLSYRDGDTVVQAPSGSAGTDNSETP